jgi:hypothetical protein
MRPLSILYTGGVEGINRIKWVFEKVRNYQRGR